MLRSKLLMILFVLGFFLNIFQTNVVFSQEDEIIDTQKLMDMMSPCEAHRNLQAFEGKWRQLCELPQQNEAPTFGKGEAINEVILGGRYVKIRGYVVLRDYPVETEIIIGFDRRYDHYTLFYVDGLSTYFSLATGNFFPDKKRFVFKGEISSGMDDSTEPFKVVITFESERKFTYKIYVGEGKKEMLRQTIVNVKTGELEE